MGKGSFLGEIFEQITDWSTVTDYACETFLEASENDFQASASYMYLHFAQRARSEISFHCTLCKNISYCSVGP